MSVDHLSVRMSDVAARAGVSQSTVSRVMHDKGYVATETRRKVLKAVRELDYQMNLVAQSLKARKTWVLGHVLFGLQPNPFFSQVADGVDAQATSLGYNVITCNAHHDAAQEARHVEMLLGRRVDGIVFTVPVDPANVARVVEAGLPCIMVERPVGTHPADKVLADNRQGAAQAVAHLLNQGHRDIAFIGARHEHPVEHQRLEGFREALYAQGLAVREDWVLLRGAHMRENGYILGQQVLAMEERPSAVLVASDPMAVGLLQSLYEARLRVPDDISVVSFDDTLAEFLAPPLTAVRQPMQDMGSVAVQTLVERIDGSAMGPKTIILGMELHIRQSTRPL